MGEMNVTLKKDASPEKFADTIQTLARYVLNDFPLPCTCLLYTSLLIQKSYFIQKILGNRKNFFLLHAFDINRSGHDAVSYTHLDVYKRQR